ncbi:Winged helix DNA-binding domain [Frankia torreyi]|uniref:Winged helix DNA-binding domain n=1 Tax=Frankia torreyi TaxID=1856 RepID=A0A0D8BAK0_9ACTN|nr:crosslink repair DNA glycosylase YcaQ family protein [Frankia torreyi]KJE21201.1 Winged helix DNA-binding domain [Frankia torreyi]
MISRRPRTVGAVTLTDVQARRLWNWTLSRQGLHPRRRLTSAAQISHAALGLHAARLPSPFATVLARAEDPEVALSLFSRSPGLITLRCMRRTLHLLPVDLAAAAHRATVHYRLRDATRRAYNAGVPDHVLTQIRAQLPELLADGPLPHRRIEDALAPTSPAAVRAAVKIAWESGTLTYLNASGCWNAERRMFGLTSQLHPGLDLDPDPRSATRMLLRAYFDRYGPATLGDATWWSALSQTAVLDALDDPETALLEVATPWSPSPAYMAADRYDQFNAADPDTYTTGLQMLAHEDVALKAYAETRTRYLADLAPRQAFNQIGEALPTVLLDGEVCGTWSWEPASRTVVATLLPGQATTTIRQVTAATEGHTEALRAGWRPPALPAARPDPRQLALAL